MTEPRWLPEPDEHNAPFFAGAGEGKLRLQYCEDCGTWAFPVITRCGDCGGDAITWRDASGRGTVYAHAQLERGYHPRHEGRLVVLAQVDIEEGLRVITNIVDVEPGEVRAGDAVEVCFETAPEGTAIPVFRPVSGG